MCIETPIVVLLISLYVPYSAEGDCRVDKDEWWKKLKEKEVRCQNAAGCRASLQCHSQKKNLRNKGHKNGMH